jgi:hypothetical protein
MMQKHDRAALLVAFAFSFLTEGCSAAEKTKVQPMLPTAHVVMGMSERALQSQSSVQFRIEDGGNIKALWIDQPYDLEYGEGKERLVLKGIGGKSLSTGVTATNGKVDTVTIVPQNRLLTLPEAIERTQELAELLKGAGFAPNPESSWFRVWGWNSKSTPAKPTAATLQEARTVLSDGQTMVSEASLYAATNDTLSAVVGARNGRRMRAVVGDEAARDESGAATAREWTLELSIVPKVEN